MKTPADVGGRDGFRGRFNHTYEDDIEFRIRAAVELGIRAGYIVPDTGYDLTFGIDQITPDNYQTELRRCHFDIETSGVETNNRIASWENPVNRIYSSAHFDSYTQQFTIFIWHEKYKNGGVYSLTYDVPIDTTKREFSAFSDRYPVTIRTFDNEYDMLTRIVDYFAAIRFDLVTGWNMQRFDMPYLIARMRQLGVNYRRLSPLGSVYIRESGQAVVKGLIVFDTWLGFKKTLTSERESNRLGDVAEDILGVGKVVHDGHDRMYEVDRDKLILYNIQDVFLEYAIGTINNVFQFFHDVKCFSGCHYDDVLNNSRIVDAFFLFVAKEKGIVLPSKRTIKKDSKYKGATVIEPPSAGIKRRVAVLDLKSLYPMIMLMFNVGEDTLVVNPDAELIPNLIRTPLKGVYFRKDKKSFIAEILSGLIKYRDNLKADVARLKNAGNVAESLVTDRIQVVVKFITNSIYGVLGWERFRLYNKLLAACVPAVSRLVIKFTISHVKNSDFGGKINYGDTDSIFYLLAALTREGMVDEMYELCDSINSAYESLAKKMNCDECLLLMRPEKIYATMIQVMLKSGARAAKKRYAGLKIGEEKIDENGNPTWAWLDTPKMDVKGFSRTDMSRLSKTVMKSVIRMACHERDKREIIDYVRAVINGVRNGHYELHEIAFSKGIRKRLSEYGNQDWIRAARWTNRWSSMWGAQTNFGANTKPKFIYVKERSVPAPYDRTDIIALDENNFIPAHLAEIIDYDKVIEKLIGDKIRTILESIGINWKSITDTHKCVILDNFMRK
jgi:DNA polymerase I/DNA polymerase-2